MAGAPNSYKDGFWTTLAANTEQKLGLPEGLLQAIVTKGERSNNDQVSEAGARTVFQIIPATRKAAIDKYGIDPYLSPENAAEVAGLLLKDSLDRNKGDAAAAVGEYHGGTDRANWGARTKTYIERVTAALPIPGTNAAGPAGQSTFDRVSAEMNKPTESAIANVFNAYQAGQMSPEEAKQFEQDVNAGRIMLPRGASLSTPASPEVATSSNMLPAAVIDAYANGQMTPQERAQLESDVQSGLVTLPPGTKLGNTSAIAQIPGNGPNANTNTTPEEPQSLVDKIIGTGEAGLNLLTAGTSGAVGALGGAIGGMAGSIANGDFGTQQGVRNVEDAVDKGMQKMTYQPRTAAGQQMAGAVGEAINSTIPVAPMIGELSQVGHGTVPALEAVRDATKAGVATVKQAVPAAVERVQQVVGKVQDAASTPGTMGSVGSAGTDIATQRRQLASDLPVPIELTKGQAERTFEQQRFEQEAAKDQSLGAPLRDRYAQQNENILKNFDAWVDQTGAEAPNLRAVGQAVDAALVKKAARDKAEIRVAYKNAEKSGELAEPVRTDYLVKFLNESSSAEAVAPVLKAAKAELQRLGGTEEAGGALNWTDFVGQRMGNYMKSEGDHAGAMARIAREWSEAKAATEGTLAPKELSLGDMELLRRFINRVAGADPTNIKYAADMKRIIDATTEGMGGDLYKQARSLRARYAEQYENRAVISKLLDTKRGTADRSVALEDVWNHSVMKGSLDDVRTLRKVLQTAGDDGKQAWRELQGATVNWIREEATKGVATDQRGNPIVSAAGLNKAIRALDHDGKLDFVFGKNGAQQLRDINDLAKVVFTSPPGAVNTSNTASVLIQALAEAGAWGGTTGIPVPVLTGLRQIAIRVKDRRIQKRIEEALGKAQRAADAKKAAELTPAYTKKTLH